MECWDCYQQKTWKTWEQGLSGVIKFPILKGSNNAMVWYFEWFPLEWCIVWVEDIMTPAVTLLFWTFHRLAGFQKWWLINPFLQVMFLHEVPVIEKRKTDQTTTKTVAMDRMDFAGVGCGASNFQKSFEVLLMEEILHQLIGTGSLSHYLQGFLHLRVQDFFHQQYFKVCLKILGRSSNPSVSKNQSVAGLGMDLGAFVMILSTCGLNYLIPTRRAYQL